MKVRNRNFRKSKASHNFWPAFTDVMSTIVLVFFFLILLAYFQQIISVSAWNEKLDNAKIELRQTEQNLEKKKLEISEKEKALRMLTEEQARLKAEVEMGKQQLKLSLAELQKKEQIIANSNEELAKLRAKLQNISVLRLNILEDIKKSIEQQLGARTTPTGEPLVTIGDNANLVINERLLFKSGSAEISYEGKKLLDKFALAFEAILDQRDKRDSIDSIDIQGHADIDGSSDYNWDLSTERAREVLKYILHANPDLEKKYPNKFSATGFSEFRPLDPGLSEEAKQKNRRIEISIIIKDSHVQKIIQEYLNDTKAE